ncbi:MAG: OmpA family protein [Microscillaceae bacterium]|nr:OmpA family protein [Microscillaceae bacterium]
MLRILILFSFFLISGIFHVTLAQEEGEDSIPKNKKEIKEKKPKNKKLKPENSSEETDTKEETTPYIHIELKSYLKSPGLTLKSKQVLDELLKILPAYPDLFIRVEGHTSNYNFLEDREESLEQGQDRSQKQADMIKDYLINKGLHADMISAEGFGASRPKIVGYYKKDKPIYLENNNQFAQMSNERIILQIEVQFEKDFASLSKELEKKNILHKSFQAK